MAERYYGFPEYCRRNFGRKLYRVALDAGMTCPNRDGSIAKGGCIFCSEGGSGEFAVPYCGRRLTPEDFTWFYGDARPGDYIAYFQSFTNTYAPVSRLRFLFEAALSDPVFAGISIATRPDSIREETYALLRELKEHFPEKFVWIELGLQSASDETARYIRRGYETHVYRKCAEQLNQIGIPFIVHMIIGLPGEGEKEWAETIRCINETGASGVKLQLLHYLKGTTLGRWYEEEAETGANRGGRKIRALTEEEYVKALAECLSLLNPDIVIHRLTGDGAADALLAPSWSRNKKHVLNALRHELKESGLSQGSRCPVIRGNV